MKYYLLWWRPMVLNAHPTSANVALWRAWTLYRETKPQMETHLQSCMRSNASPCPPIQQIMESIGHFMMACPSIVGFGMYRCLKAQ